MLEVMKGEKNDQENGAVYSRRSTMAAEERRGNLGEFNKTVDNWDEMN